MHYINTFQINDAQRGVGMMPKRGCDVNTCEISKFYRLNNNGFCQVVSMTVPRKSELFQEDLYPDTLSDEPALTAEEWMAGKNADPILVSLKVSLIVLNKYLDLETNACPFSVILIFVFGKPYHKNLEI